MMQVDEWVCKEVISCYSSKQIVTKRNPLSSVADLFNEEKA